MTVTHTPTGQDLKCLVCLTDKDIDIDHVVNRGMGGSKQRDIPENRVPLCRECHTAKTNNVLDTHVAELDGYYAYRWRRKVEGAPWITVPVEVSQRYKCLVLSDGAEGGSSEAEHRSDGRRTPPGSDWFESSSSSAPSPSAGAEVKPRSSRAEHQPYKLERVGSNPTGATPSVLTHDERVAIAAEIKDAKQRHPFFAGDTANLWEEELGEEFWNTWADRLGYTYPSLRNVMRVCKKIPPDKRNPEASFALHDVVDGFDFETQEAWLERAVTEEWPVKRLREELVAEGLLGARVRVKRYSLEELQNWAREYGSVPQAEAVLVFLDWLGDQSNVDQS